MVRRLHSCALIVLASVIAPANAPAEEIALRPRYQVGDRYALTLSLDTSTRVHAARGGGRNPSRDSFKEDVELHYTAEVEVLETDAAGLPLRERHEVGELTSKRPEGTRALFVKGAAFSSCGLETAKSRSNSAASGCQRRSRRSSAICSRIRPNTGWRPCSIRAAP